MPTCQKCSDHFPNLVKIDGKTKNLCSRKYCLNCSPFGEHTMNKLHQQTKTESQDSFSCGRCKEVKTKSDFYNRGGGRGGERSSYCKKCVLVTTLAKQRNFKLKCVDYKGGKCITCDYSKNMAALEFHHLSPAEKDFAPSHYRSQTWSKKVEQELDKCILLCANCHREIHNPIGGISS